MTNTKSTKRALLMSGLALLMCVSMLIGSTFAWFTDSVTSAGNTIQSGTLKVDLVDEDGNSLEGKVLKFVDQDENDLWEPGCTYNLQKVFVANKGNLALKYEIAINGITGDAKLLEAIEWEITVGEGEKKQTKTLSELNGFLLPNTQSDALVLSGHMKESAGNEYQGLTVEGISISVFATQYTYEKDSFDEKYDELATYMNKNADGEWEIESLGQLIYFAKSVNEGNSYEGETVVLTNDIDLNGINWTPIGNWDNTFDGTFDGQGYTISNLYINNPIGEGVGLFGVTYKATIKGVNIENVDITAYSMVSALVGAPYPSTISDCNVTGKVNLVAEWAYVGGIAGYCYYGTQVDNCSVVADEMGSIVSKTRNAVGGITAWLLEGNHKVSNCEVKNLNLTGWTNIGGITGFVHYNNTIEGCSVENVKITKTRADGNPGIGLVAGGWSYSASNAITLRNNTVKNATLEGNHVAYAAYNELYGSEYDGKTTTNFVLEGNTTEQITNNLVEVKKVSDAVALTNALANGDNVVLAADINVSETTFSVPSGKTVVLNMNGKTISGTFNNTSNVNKNLFEVNGNLTIDGEGVVTMNTTGINMGWNAMSCTFHVTGGDLTVNDTTIKNEGGTDMAYAIDTNPWNAANDAVLEVVLNNAKVESTYRGIRVRDNGPYLVKLVANDSDIDEIWYQEYSSGDNVNKGNYGILVEVVLNNTTCDTSRVNPTVLTIN